MKVNKLIANIGIVAASLACSASYAGWAQVSDPNSFDAAVNPGFGLGGPGNQSAATVELWLEDLLDSPVNYVSQMDTFSAGSITGLTNAPTSSLFITLHYGNYQVAGNKVNNVTVAWNCTSGCATFTGYVTKGLSNYREYQAVTAVPEPETFAMLLAGLGLIGSIARRRSNKSA